MDITPIYELQTRLRAAAIAGVRLLQEDFRLKRAAEAVRPLEGASPVFAKLNQQMASLLDADCADPVSVLLDTMALADAVVCTLGAVEVTGEMEDATDSTTKDAAEDLEINIVSAPCSQIKPLIEALTTSGSGNYAYVQNVRRTSPEIFRDYRVRHAMVQALGASYAELADLVKVLLISDGDYSILPLLKKDFDPKGKKEMQRRLEIIIKTAGEKENDFYIEMLGDSEKEIRLELIKILGASPSNVNLLLDMANTEKGKNQQMVYRSLAGMEDNRVYGLFEKMAEKKPEEVCEYLITSTTEGASKIISRMCLKLLPEILELPEEKSKIKRFCRCVEALAGKSGEDVLKCYRLLLENREKLDRLAGSELEYAVVQPDYTLKSDKKYTWERTIGMHLAISLVVSDNAQIAEFVMEQYENTDKSDCFLTAAAFVKMSRDGRCTEWFDEQLQGNIYSEDQINNRLEAVKAALKYVQWDEKRREHMMCGYIHGYQYTYGAENKFFRRTFSNPNYKAVMEWMMIHKWDDLLYYWTIRDNAEECAKMGEWYYNRFLDMDKQPAPNARGTMLQYLDYMNGCKWTTCKGLGELFAMRGQPFLDTYHIQRFFENLPGPKEEARAEMDVFIRLVEEHKVKGIGDNGADYYKYLREQIFKE